MQTETPPRKKSLSERIFEQTWIPTILLPVLVGIMLIGLWMIPPQAPAERSEGVQARDDAAVQRAESWLHTLGFEPGPAICRSASWGSAWCTIRVAGTDRTYSLFCSYRHPHCVENMATFKW